MYELIQKAKRLRDRIANPNRIQTVEDCADEMVKVMDIVIELAETIKEPLQADGPN